MIPPADIRGRKPHILVLGASGFLGQNLLAGLGSRGVGTFCEHPVEGQLHFDALSMNVDDLLDRLPTITHAVILFGITRLNECAGRPILSASLNVVATKRCIVSLMKRDIVPVFTSSNMVFDGKKGHYEEGDSACPIVEYGSQKLEIERHLVSSDSPFLVFRLDKVCGSTPHDSSMFTSWIDAVLAKRQPIRCASDETFSPVFVDDAVSAMIGCLDHGLSGIFHIAGPDAHSRLQLFDILRSGLIPILGPIPPAVECSIDEFAAEKRPLRVSLSIAKIQRGIRYTPLSMRELCAIVIARYMEAGILTPAQS